MAGTASTVPATRPFTASWAIWSSEPGTSDHLHELELALLRLIEPDLAIQDIARVGEVARPAGSLVIDRLALGQELQPFDRTIDFQAVALGDLSHVIAD